MRMTARRALTALGVALAAVGVPQAGGAVAGELVMFQSRSCAWCAAWELEVGTVYEKTDEARTLTLRRVDADRDRTGGIKLAAPVEFTPTFVIVACGRELGRIAGYPGEDHFWGLLGTEIARHRAGLVAPC
ncbi:MAG TPA: thioredoxin family protein [Vineibacter sp.]|nr:thioredoxin family protein [Vineibacter sp.]